VLLGLAIETRSSRVGANPVLPGEVRPDDLRKPDRSDVPY
jgi:hypothetical protein